MNKIAMKTMIIKQKQGYGFNVFILRKLGCLNDKVAMVMVFNWTA